MCNGSKCNGCINGRMKTDHQRGRRAGNGSRQRQQATAAGNDSRQRQQVTVGGSDNAEATSFRCISFRCERIGTERRILPVRSASIIACSECNVCNVCNGGCKGDCYNQSGRPPSSPAASVTSVTSVTVVVTVIVTTSQVGLRHHLQRRQQLLEYFLLYPCTRNRRHRVAVDRARVPVLEQRPLACAEGAVAGRQDVTWSSRRDMAVTWSRAVKPENRCEERIRRVEGTGGGWRRRVEA